MKINLSVIEQIESSGNPLAENKASGARGLCQITKICLDDYNLTHPKKQIAWDAMFDPYLNRLVAAWYFFERLPHFFSAFQIPPTLENFLFAYNAGTRTLRKYLQKEIGMPEETRRYIEKYKELSK